MRTTDNNGGKPLNDFDDIDAKIPDLAQIANRSLLELQKDNPDLLIFPHSFGRYHDDVEKPIIFSLDEHRLSTQNLMGFIGRNNTQLTISSRFTKNSDTDYFLHYMLQKVFSINLLDFDQTPNKDSIWDFLLYLFPSHLKKAYAQGMYKAYRTERYNNANVKGTIDVKRHLKQNSPFTGNISYTTREHSYDNALTQLIRHTIEYIATHPFGNTILTQDSEVRDIVSKFVFVTSKNYNRNSRQRVMSDNVKTVAHPYFTEYTALQKLCLKILKHEKIAFGQEKDRIYGLLFDGAWLWEEYLNTLLKDDFIHPENKTGKNKFHLFEQNSKSFQSIFPDFISSTQPISVGDAKYIPLEQRYYNEGSEKATSIYYKTLAYMYRFNSLDGFLLFPSPDTAFYDKYTIIDTGGQLRKIGLAIPQGCGMFKDFNNAMINNEKEVKSMLTISKLSQKWNAVTE